MCSFKSPTDLLNLEERCVISLFHNILSKKMTQVTAILTERQEALAVLPIINLVSYENERHRATI